MTLIRAGKACQVLVTDQSRHRMSTDLLSGNESRRSLLLGRHLGTGHWSSGSAAHLGGHLVAPYPPCAQRVSLDHQPLAHRHLHKALLSVPHC